MTKDEMKNKISMALKDPALQQGFEIICKDLAISEHDREHNDYELAEVYKQVKELKEENAELEKELEQAKKVQVVEHFEAYGQCRDSRRIASLETENVELKDKLNNLSKVAEVRLANWQKYEKENAELKAQIEKLKLCQNCKFEDNDFIEEPCSACTRCLGDIKRKGNSDKWELQEN